MKPLCKPASGRIATTLATTALVVGGSLLGAAATSPAGAATPPQISVAFDMVKQERNTSAKSHYLQFVRTGDLSQSSSVTVNIVSGTATAGSDFTAVHYVTTLAFPKGRNYATVQVRVRGDRTVETDETFDFTLSDAVGATIGDGSGTFTIVNDD